MQVSLNDDEMLLLDGKCSEEVQAKVNIVKSQIAMKAKLTSIKPEFASFIADTVERAKTYGALSCTYKGLRYCKVCNATAGYALYTRSTRWHRKGDKNMDRPLTLSGIELAQGFISFQGYANLGCCNKCWAEIKPLLVKELEGVEAEIPTSITGKPPEFKKYDNRKCTVCGWTGHEGLMGRSCTLMGDGTYPSTCPKCNQKDGLFEHKINSAPGFAVLPIKKPEPVAA